MAKKKASNRSSLVFETAWLKGAKFAIKEDVIEWDVEFRAFCTPDAAKTLDVHDLVYKGETYDKLASPDLPRGGYKKIDLDKELGEGTAAITARGLEEHSIEIAFDKAYKFVVERKPQGGLWLGFTVRFDGEGIAVLNYAIRCRMAQGELKLKFAPPPEPEKKAQLHFAGPEVVQ